MHRLLFMCLDAFIAGLVMIPIFILLNTLVFHSKSRSILYFTFAIYLCGMFAIVGLPDIQYIRFDLNYNFIPFAYMFSDYRSSLLNVLLFMPMGIFLPLLWKAFLPAWKAVLFGLFTSLLIETLQIFTFRATDINDLITNSVGTFIGWCIARTTLHFNSSILPGEPTKDVYIVCATAFFVMFFIHPYATNLILYFL